MEIEYPEWMARYQKPQVLAGGAVLIFVLVVALIWTAWRWNVTQDRMEMMQAQAAVGFLQPPSSTRTVHVDLRAGRLIGIDAGGFATRVDLAIAVTGDRFDRYRIARFDTLGFGRSAVPGPGFRWSLDGLADDAPHGCRRG